MDFSGILRPIADLRDAFPSGNSLEPLSAKRNVRAIGDRLEGKAQAAVVRVSQMLETTAEDEIAGYGIALQIGAVLSHIFRLKRCMIVIEDRLGRRYWHWSAPHHCRKF